MLFTLEQDLNEYGGRKTMSIAWSLGYIDMIPQPSPEFGAYSCTKHSHNIVTWHFNSISASFHIAKSCLQHPNLPPLLSPLFLYDAPSLASFCFVACFLFFAPSLYLVAFLSALLSYLNFFFFFFGHSVFGRSFVHILFPFSSL
jgi:hypothetical protein